MGPPRSVGRPPLPPTFPDLRSLELFTAVCRLGSLGAAAAAHGMSQPSVSTRIRSLERRLGFTLLNRGATGSTPTPNGVLVAQWADRLLDAAEELDAALGSLTRAPTAPVTIAASYTIAEFLLPGWLGAWRREANRGAELEVVNSSEVLVRVAHGEVELGFVEITGAIEGLNSVEVARDELIGVVAPGHRLAGLDRPLGADELEAVDLVCREMGSGTREALTQALAAVGARPPHPTLELGSTSAVRGAVVGGAGLAVLSRLAVAADLAAGTLIEVEVAAVDLRRPLQAVWKPERLSPAGEALLELARRG
ncbi:MAG: LysR family transcriptional regulator [Microthrixaceae bacterium]|nr:LysR family transcriptional regulator [Microthrixaceae bacterium]